jgi:hypothetical protein
MVRLPKTIVSEVPSLDGRVAAGRGGHFGYNSLNETARLTLLWEFDALRVPKSRVAGRTGEFPGGVARGAEDCLREGSVVTGRVLHWRRGWHGGWNELHPGHAIASLRSGDRKNLASRHS